MRADLRRFYGVSLTQMFDGEIAPDEIWDYVVHLPRMSATTTARLADPETVFSDDEDAEPPWQDWTPEAQRLDDVCDALAVISDQIAKIGTKHRVKVTPRRRPGDALRKAMQERRRAQARAEWAELCDRLGVPH